MRHIFAAVAICLASQASAEAPQPQPIEAFAALPFIESPQLSPSGDKVAARIAIDGVQQLGVFQVGDAEKAALISLGEYDLNSWQWVNEDWLILNVGSSTNVQGDDWYITRAVGVSADGKTAKPLLFKQAGQMGGDLLWIARDGSPRVLLASQQSIYPDRPEFWPAVFEVDVSTAKAKPVLRSYANVMDWYADTDGTVRMGIYRDQNRRSRLLYRDTSDENFRTVDRAVAAKDESLTVPALFLQEPGKALAYDDKEGFEALYELDLKTLSIGKKVFGVDGYDLGGLVRDQNGTGLAGIRYTADGAAVHWLDPQLKDVQLQIDKAVGARRASIVSLSRDRSKMIVEVGGPSSAGAYYYFDTAYGSMQLLAHANQTLKNVALSPVRTIRYKARDGLSIPAILTLPKNREARNLPLIVMPHGGPRVRDSEQWDWWAQFVADRGYAVIQPNYRGSTGFGIAFEEAGMGEWGLKMQDDLNDAVAHLASEGIADPKRVCMVGGSYGGYAALRAAQRDGKLYRCAISFAGVSDLAHLARSDAQSLYSRDMRAYWREQAPDLKAVSPINFASEFSIPTLLVHGKKDLRVPVKQSREMAERLKAAGKTFQYVEQREGDHHFSREQDRLEFLKLLEAFLVEHNPA